MKYNGTDWEVVGTPGISQGDSYYESIAIDGSGTPYVVYQDAEGSSWGATVVKYNGSSWETVGNAEFSAEDATYTNIAIDSSGTPYVSYQDSYNSDKITVMKYNGSDWETVGTAGFSLDMANSPSIAISKNGTPYVVYYGADPTMGKATVMKYSGRNWQVVGNSEFSGSGAGYTTIAIDENGNPYVAYSDGENTQKVTVMTIVEDKDVTSVDSLNDIKLSIGTDKSNIGLPDTIDVELSNLTTTSVAVTWDNENPAYDGNTAGTYVFTGTLTLPDGVANPNNYTASVNVIVEAKEVTSVDSLNYINLSIGTDESDIGLPDTIDVTLSDGTTTSAAVTWDNGSPTYDENTEGTYTFTGTLTLPDGIANTDNYTATDSETPENDEATGNDETTPGAVRIEGTAKVGDTLIAQLKDADGNNYTTSAAVTYEWYRLDSADSEFTDEIGTGATYKLTGSDLSKYIGVRVTFGEYSFEYFIGGISASISSSSHHHSNTTTTSTNTDTKKSDDNNNNIKKIGWTEETTGKKYYIKDDGNKTTDWKKLDDKRYFFNNKNGEMVTGWYKSETGDWTYDSKDTMGQWFHLGTDGKMDTSWFKDTDGTWYYLCDGRDYGALGYMEMGWKYIDGKWYFLKDNGAMSSNTVVDGYTLGEDGALV